MALFKVTTKKFLLHGGKRLEAGMPLKYHSMGVIFLSAKQQSFLKFRDNSN